MPVGRYTPKVGVGYTPNAALVPEAWPTSCGGPHPTSRLSQAYGNGATPESGRLTSLWVADSYEHQIRELEFANRELRRAAARRGSTGAPGTWHSPSGQQATHAGAEREQLDHANAEVASLREENRALEAEGIAFKQRMEEAVDSFELIVERASQEKEEMATELVAVRQQLIDVTDAHETQAESERQAAAGLAQRAACMSWLLGVQEEMGLGPRIAAAFVQWKAAATFVDSEQELREEVRRKQEVAQQFEGMLSEASGKRDDAELELANLREEMRKLHADVQRITDAAEITRQDLENSQIQVRASSEENERLKQAEAVLRARVEECGADLNKVMREREERVLAARKDDEDHFKTEFAAQAEQAHKQLEEAVGQERAEAQSCLASLQAEHETALRTATDSAAVLAAEAASKASKLEAMAQMVRAQQAELTEGYHFAATCKLSSAVHRRLALTLAYGFAAWRSAVRLSEAAMQQAAALQEASRATEALQESFAADASQKEATLLATVDSLSAQLTESEQAVTTAAAAAVAASEQFHADREAAIKQERLEADSRVAEAHSSAAAVAADLRAELQSAKSASEAAVAQSALDEAVGQERAEARARLASLQAEHEKALRTATESAPSAKDASQASKLEMMARMVRAQQAELTEGYLFAATCKLSSAIDRRLGLTLAYGFGAWQVACMASSVQDLDLQLRRTSKENRAMAVLVSDLQSQLESARDGAAPPASQHRPPLPRPASGGLVKASNSRPTSPRPSLTDQLEAARGALFPFRKPNTHRCRCIYLNEAAELVCCRRTIIVASSCARA